MTCLVIKVKPLRFGMLYHCVSVCVCFGTQVHQILISERSRVINYDSLWVLDSLMALHVYLFDYQLTKFATIINIHHIKCEISRPSWHLFSNIFSIPQIRDLNHSNDISLLIFRIPLFIGWSWTCWMYLRKTNPNTLYLSASRVTVTGERAIWPFNTSAHTQYATISTRLVVQIYTLAHRHLLQSYTSNYRKMLNKPNHQTMS